jgi:hypothetical protein
MWKSLWDENWQGKQTYWEKTCPSATYLPQISHDVACDLTQAAAKLSQQFVEVFQF